MCGEGRDSESVGHGGVGKGETVSQQGTEVWEGRDSESVGHGGVGGARQ